MKVPWSGCLGSPTISVVIPTYNRPDELRLCLDGFAQQTVPKNQFEIVIVDDGSTVDLASCVEAFRRILNVRFIRSAHAGPGGARNIALKRARAPLLLLYDDDLRPFPDLLEYCLDFHRAHPAEEDARLLPFGPDPATRDSPFAAWAFSTLYPFPLQPGIGGWGFFWSGTLTAKKSLFRHGQFDPAYLMAEDVELGLRLSRNLDLRVHFERRLTGVLTRRMTFPQICRRQYNQGYFHYVLAREYRGAVSFARPYDRPEKYFVDDRKVLAAIVASARAIESREPKPDGNSPRTPSKILSGLWSAAETHARVEGWMAARDGRPAEPPGTLGLLLERDALTG